MHWDRGFIMQNLMRDKIEKCSIDIMVALDNNDYLTALKLRAIQRELMELINLADSYEVTEKSRDEYYTVQDVSNYLGLHPTNVTRKAKELGGVKIKNKWYFPKKSFDLNVSVSNYVNKRGPKTKE